MLENHYDLYQPIQYLYREHLREQDPSLDDGALEEQVEDGWLDWYSNGAGSHHAAIDSIVDDWLSGEPDWANEWDDLYKTGNAQGAAYDHFLREDRDMLDALGIVIIEGECPGSSYFAAELHTDVDEANRIARDNGWSIRLSGKAYQGVRPPPVRSAKAPSRASSIPAAVSSARYSSTSCPDMLASPNRYRSSAACG